MRVSELVDIRWQQIHLDTATVDIRRAKNGTPGIHGLQGDQLRLLRALRRDRPHADFVFLSERKGPLSVDGAQKLIEWLGKAAGLPFPIHAHMLRHAAGYALAARGVDTRTLQAFMGHRSIANTVIYTAVADKRIRHLGKVTTWIKGDLECELKPSDHIRPTGSKVSTTILVFSTTLPVDVASLRDSIP